MKSDIIMVPLLCVAARTYSGRLPPPTMYFSSSIFIKTPTLRCLILVDKVHIRTLEEFTKQNSVANFTQKTEGAKVSFLPSHNCATLSIGDPCSICISTISPGQYKIYVMICCQFHPMLHFIVPLTKQV